ncbi:hypothetical protein J4437_03830 [Candidatus Woesearchaeota archaeon]|nr:hypothetical protein [Candidatus Woesearchaeota archaeon]
MKHSAKITIILLTFFLFAQLIGLFILSHYIDREQSQIQGKPIFKDLPLGERPPLDEKTSYVPIISAIFVGTILLLVLIKLNWVWVWKAWFLLAVIMSLTMAFGAFFGRWVALSFALILGVWKIFKPNFWIQNFTELFIYGGLAAIFVPILNLWSISILLILIAIYDAYAVWKSKHMITLAQSQTKAKLFAGLYIPYDFSALKGKLLGKKKSNFKKVENKTIAGKNLAQVPVKVRTAVLGGGDIGFPLLFAGVVFKEIGGWYSLIITLFSLAGLAFLLWYGKEEKFYPAMPFIGAGCFLGLGVIWLIRLIIGF